MNQSCGVVFAQINVTLTEEAKACADFSRILNSNHDLTLSELRDPQGRIVLNADDLFRQYPPYRDHLELRRILGPILYGVAKDFINRAFLRLLSEPV